MTKHSISFATGFMTLCALTLAGSFARAQAPDVPVAHRLGTRRSGDVRVGPQALAKTRLQSGLNLSFGLVDFPRSPYSTANGINSRGDIVGFYGPNLPAWDGTEQSYLLHGNSFQEISYPGASYTGALGINKSRAIVGWYSGTDGIYHGFLLKGKKYTNIDDPAFQNTIPSNINDSGEIIGEAFDATGNIHGFLFRKGTYTTFDPPNSINTEPIGINSTGVIVGNFVDENTVAHGFVFQGGQFTTIDYPGASSTDLTGINDQGQMIGGYGDDVMVAGDDWPTPNAFLLDHGVFTPLAAPFGGVEVTWTYTLTGHQFVGLYVDSLGNIEGFEATLN